jgi:uncharacterized DUF497 family protein
VYNFAMRFTWNGAKRKANLKKHGLDFADVEHVFSGPMVLIEDNRNLRRTAHDRRWVAGGDGGRGGSCRIRRPDSDYFDAKGR